MAEHREFFVCSCGHMDHLIRLTFWDDDEPDDQMIYLQMSLNPRHGLFRRLWSALRYVAGYGSRYGHFDEVILEPADVRRLREFLERFEAAQPAGSGFAEAAARATAAMAKFGVGRTGASAAGSGLMVDKDKEAE